MAAVPTTGTGSALAAQQRDYLHNFQAWLVSNGQTGKGMVGEMGIPGSCAVRTEHDYDPGFTAAMQQEYIDMNAYGMHATVWCSAEWSVALKAYLNTTNNNNPFSYRSTVSSVIEQNPSVTTGSNQYMRGVNITGADFSDTGPSGGLNAGQAPYQYYYPQAADFTVLAARGIKLVRLPFRWERLQPTLKQPFDTTQISYITAALANAHAAGIVLLLDLHNYGRYDTAAATNTSGSTSGVLDLGQNAPGAVGGTMISCFADFWTRFATQFHGTPGLWSYGLCNEPHDLTGNVGTWQTATQQAVEAIRLIDQVAHINVGGYNYQGIQLWPQNNGNTAWLTETIPAGQTGAGSARNTDPLIIWEGHKYYDYDGTYSDDNGSSTFTSLNQNAINQGYAAYTNSTGNVAALDITSQNGQVNTFSTTMDSTYDWTSGAAGATATTGATTTATYANSNTVTLPYATLGNPGNSMQVICTATSDEGTMRKTLVAGSTAAIFSFDYYIPTGATVSNTSNFAIMHGWDQNYVNATGNNIIEVRVLGNGSGYVFCLTNPNGSYTTVNGTTQVALGAWNHVQVVVNSTNFSIYVNGSSTADAVLTASNSGITIGGIALGKFYGTSYVGPMYYDNFAAGNIATYDAPPNGGLLAVTVAPPVITNTHGLIGFF